MVVDALNKALGDRGLHGNVRHVFQAELDKEKRSYLLKHQQVPAVFGDVCEVATGSSFEHRTCQSLQVPGCDILVAGYSCKDLSGLNNKPAAIHDTSRGSGQTLQAALSYVSRYEPAIVVLENVKTMYCVRSMDQGQKPMAYLTAQMKSKGYVGPEPQMLLNSFDFGLPQSRPRAWMVFFHTGKVKGAETLVQRLPDRVCSLRHQPRPLKEVLADDEMDVVSDFAFVTASSPEVQDALLQAKHSGPKWVDLLAAFMEEHQISEQELGQKIAELYRTLTSTTLTSMPASFRQFVGR
ncbi:hpaIIM [Symbiodinium sp. CCMP2592]|nr:hpaIIM [Symbiodinium sp. CCMP2592]